MASDAGFEAVAVEYVGTLHRYGAKIPVLGRLLGGAEQLLPERRRSTIVGSLRVAR